MLTVLSLVGLMTLPFQTPASGPADTPARFADTLLMALARAGSARDALQSVKPTGVALVDTFEVMTARRQAIVRIQQARRLLDGFDKSRDEMTREATGAFTTAFTALEAAWQAGVAIDERFLAVDDTKEFARLVSESSRTAVLADEAWRLLPVGMAMMTHALIDTTRLRDGKIAYLRITSAERRELIATIGRLFPKAADTGGGHAVDVSAGLLRVWLRGPLRSTDEHVP